MSKRNYVAKFARRFNKGGAHQPTRRDDMSYQDEIEAAWAIHEAGEDDYAEVICPSCGTQQPHDESYQGNLGVIEHHRCRFCGANFSFRPTEDRP